MRVLRGLECFLKSAALCLAGGGPAPEKARGPSPSHSLDPSLVEESLLRSSRGTPPGGKTGSVTHDYGERSSSLAHLLTRPAPSCPEEGPCMKSGLPKGLQAQSQAVAEAALLAWHRHSESQAPWHKAGSVDCEPSPPMPTQESRDQHHSVSNPSGETPLAHYPVPSSSFGCIRGIPLPGQAYQTPTVSQTSAPAPHLRGCPPRPLLLTLLNSPLTVDYAASATDAPWTIIMMQLLELLGGAFQ